MKNLNEITLPNLNEIAASAQIALAHNVPGYTFLGAWPEAKKQGYVKDSIEFNLFTSYFLAGLPEIVTNEKGQIIEL